jgi:hypothetical protein
MATQHIVMPPIIPPTGGVSSENLLFLSRVCPLGRRLSLAHGKVTADPRIRLTSVRLTTHAKKTEDAGRRCLASAGQAQKKASASGDAEATRKETHTAPPKKFVLVTLPSPSVRSQVGLESCSSREVRVQSGTSLAGLGTGQGFRPPHFPARPSKTYNENRGKQTQEGGFCRSSQDARRPAFFPAAPNSQSEIRNWVDAAHAS